MGKTKKDTDKRWRDCGDRYCAWCVSNREHKKRVEKVRGSEIVNDKDY